MNFNSFFFFSLTASALNYLFQSLLIFLLKPSEYSTFTLLWGKLNFFMFLGSFVFYYIALSSFRLGQIRSLQLIAMFASFFSCVMYFFYPSNYFFLFSFFIASILFSLNSGYLLKRGDQKNYLLITNFVPVIKLVLLAFMSLYISISSASVFLIIIFSLLMINVLSVFKLENLNSDLALDYPQSSFKLILMISFLTHFLPYFDVLWWDVFRGGISPEFSYLSFLNRFAFYLQLIFSNWFISKSFKSDSTNKVGFSFHSLWLFTSIVLTLMFGLFLKYFLSKDLDVQLLFAFSLSSVFLAHAFLMIQKKSIVLNQSKDMFLFLILLILLWVINGIFFKHLNFLLISYFIISSFFIFFCAKKIRHS